MVKDYLKKIKDEIRREKARREAELSRPKGPPVEKVGEGKYKESIKYKVRIEKDRKALIENILKVLNIKKGKKGYDTKKEDLLKFIDILSKLPPRKNIYFTNLKYMKLSRIKEYIEAFESQDKFDSLNFLEKFISDPIIMAEIKEAQDEAEAEAEVGEEAELRSDEELEKIFPQPEMRKHKRKREEVKVMPLEQIHLLPGWKDFNPLLPFQPKLKDKSHEKVIHFEKDCYNYEETKPWILDYNYTIVKEASHPTDWTEVLSEQKFVSKGRNKQTDDYSEDNGWYRTNKLFDKYLCRLDKPAIIDDNFITIFKEDKTGAIQQIKLRVAYVLKRKDVFTVVVPPQYIPGNPFPVLTPDNQQINIVLNDEEIKPGNKIRVQYIPINGHVKLMDDEITSDRLKFFSKIKLTHRELIEELLNTSLSIFNLDSNRKFVNQVRKRGFVQLEKSLKDLVDQDFIETLEKNIYTNVSEEFINNLVKNYFIKIATISILVDDHVIRKFSRSLLIQFQEKVITPDILSGYDLQYLLPEIYNNPVIDETRLDNFEFYLKKQVNSIVYNLAHHLYRNIYPFESIPTRPEIAHMAGSVNFDIKVECVNELEFEDSGAFIYYNDKLDNKLYCITFKDIKQMRKDNNYVNPITKNPLDHGFVSYIKKLDFSEGKFVLPLPEEPEREVEREVEDVAAPVDLLAPDFLTILRTSVKEMERDLLPDKEFAVEKIALDLEKSSPETKPIKLGDDFWKFVSQMEIEELNTLSKDELVAKCKEFFTSKKDIKKCEGKSKKDLIKIFVEKIKEKKYKFNTNTGSESEGKSEGEGSGGESEGEGSEGKSEGEGSGGESEGDENVVKVPPDWEKRMQPENQRKTDCKIKTMIIKDGYPVEINFKTFDEFENWKEPKGKFTRSFREIDK